VIRRNHSELTSWSSSTDSSLWHVIVCHRVT